MKKLRGYEKKVESQVGVDLAWSVSLGRNICWCWTFIGKGRTKQNTQIRRSWMRSYAEKSLMVWLLSHFPYLSFLFPFPLSPVLGSFTECLTDCIHSCRLFFFLSHFIYHWPSIVYSFPSLLLSLLKRGLGKKVGDEARKRKSFLANFLFLNIHVKGSLWGSMLP